MVFQKYLLFLKVFIFLLLLPLSYLHSFLGQVIYSNQRKLQDVAGTPPSTHGVSRALPPLSFRMHFLLYVPRLQDLTNFKIQVSMQFLLGSSARFYLTQITLSVNTLVWYVVVFYFVWLYCHLLYF